MRPVAEFTTEPFHGEGEPPAHAAAALRAAEEAGLDCEFGPLGTTVRGDAEDLVPAPGRRPPGCSGTWRHPVQPAGRAR
ncbi:hypothetical protein [Nocardioides sp. B-3]|uniref:hypothetical protein n=1 Tax=Nocardioides sp. B-3 TaxID=2895565 RepID=UPI002152B10E|nr:hypothetical protein [Nocardioides sp. B-3]UUZ59853.1 hypothetical protein LP418_01945 [Nocardioides sp. B-3]